MIYDVTWALEEVTQNCTIRDALVFVPIKSKQLNSLIFWRRGGQAKYFGHSTPAINTTTPYHHQNMDYSKERLQSSRSRLSYLLYHRGAAPKVSSWSIGKSIVFCFWEHHGISQKLRITPPFGLWHFILVVSSPTTWQSILTAENYTTFLYLVSEIGILSDSMTLPPHD